jgi:hypothetical protein
LYLPSKREIQTLTSGIDRIEPGKVHLVWRVVGHRAEDSTVQAAQKALANDLNS